MFLEREAGGRAGPKEPILGGRLALRGGVLGRGRSLALIRRCGLGRGRKRKTEKLLELQITTATLAPRAKLLRIKHRRRMG